MPPSTEKSAEQLFARACQVMPGGVNSPVRAFKAVGGTCPFISRAEGPYVYDSRGKEYIDYVGSWGPMIFGHADLDIQTAIEKALAAGTSFGASTELEVEFAELVSEIVPSVEMLRMVSSGTEATMTAVRLARGYTGRDHIIKFNGCYHGHADTLLVAAGSGVATLGIAGSPGIPDEIAKLTASIEFNDLELLEKTVLEIGSKKVAAVILEPVPGNMGLVQPLPGYLEGVRELCTKHGIVLIFDEVMCGFRVALGGAQERFQVMPDLTCLGKVIGGGLPVGAVGGVREIMEHLAPVGSVYQAGTLSGNPLAVTAGITALRKLRDTNPYPALEELGGRFVDGLFSLAKEANISLTAACCGSMFGFFFSETPVRNFSDAKAANGELFKKFFHGMVRKRHLSGPVPI